MAKHVLWLALVALAATGCKKQHPSEVEVARPGAGEEPPGPPPYAPPPAAPVCVTQSPR
jgi:hypothetical protein